MCIYVYSVRICFHSVQNTPLRYKRCDAFVPIILVRKRINFDPPGANYLTPPPIDAPTLCMPPPKNNMGSYAPQEQFPR